MEYDYTKEIHQVGREGNDSVVETMYSHAVNNKLCITREGTSIIVAVVDANNKKILGGCNFTLEVNG